MPSQLEVLKKSLAKLLAEGASPDNPFIRGLKMQIIMDEKPRAENPMDSREVNSEDSGEAVFGRKSRSI